MAHIDTTLAGLEWMQDELDAERASIAARETDRSLALRQRQSAQRRAAAARIAGTPLTDAESRFLFRSVIVPLTATDSTDR